MTMKFARVFSLDERSRRLDHEEECWQRWAETSCIERHGEHLWVLELYLGSLNVDCSYCLAAFPTGYVESLVGSFPVRVEIVTEVYRSMEGNDYDVQVEVSPR